jgi:hypothetical protein
MSTVCRFNAPISRPARANSRAMRALRTRISVSDPMPTA